VAVKNTGTTDLKYKVTSEPASSSDDNDLYANLGYKLNVYNGSDELKETFTGASLNDLTNFEISEHVNSGEERQLGLELNLPSSLGSDIEGQTTNFRFVFEAVQSNGVF